MATDKLWDVFISYASEDKRFGNDLAVALEKRGLRVWYDAFEMHAGDSVRRSIDQGIANSRYGIIVLSTAYFSKEWTKWELDGLIGWGDHAEQLRRRILPIWHGVTKAQVYGFSPSLSDKLAISSEMPLDELVDKILKAIYVDRLVIEGWTPCPVPWPDGSTMMVVPIQPQEGCALCIAKQPVTNEQYKRFVDEAPQYLDETILDAPIRVPVGQDYKRTPEGMKWEGPFYPWTDERFNDPKQPVVCVSHEDARNYYRWVNRMMGATDGYPYTALPTPALWDIVAFGTQFPQRNPDTWKGKVIHTHHKTSGPHRVNDEDAGNSLGVANLFGNVWQWCDARHVQPSPMPPALVPPITLDTRGLELRGGAFLDDVSKIEPFIPVTILPSGRFTCHTDLGFRVAAMVPTEMLPSEVQGKLKVAKHCPDAVFPNRMGRLATWQTGEEWNEYWEHNLRWRESRSRRRD
jgi:formylglycine-generating enzyme required for sulfatase activity